jgi:hypothetical protein
VLAAQLNTATMSTSTSTSTNTSADRLLKIFAESYARNLRNNVTCGLNVTADQSMSIVCDPAALISLRNSPQCANAILNNDPNQTIICNPCAIVNASQYILIDLTAQCGADIFVTTIGELRPTFEKMYSDTHPNSYTASGNQSFLSVYNALTAEISGGSVSADIMQEVIAAQNIAVTSPAHGIKYGVFQSTVVEIVIRVMLKLQSLRGLDDLLNSPDSAPAESEPESSPNTSLQSSRANENHNRAILIILAIIVSIAVAYSGIKYYNRRRKHDVKNIVAQPVSTFATMAQ